MQPTPPGRGRRGARHHPHGDLPRRGDQSERPRGRQRVLPVAGRPRVAAERRRSPHPTPGPHRPRGFAPRGKSPGVARTPGRDHRRGAARGGRHGVLASPGPGPPRPRDRGRRGGGDIAVGRVRARQRVDDRPHPLPAPRQPLPPDRGPPVARHDRHVARADGRRAGMGRRRRAQASPSAHGRLGARGPGPRRAGHGGRYLAPSGGRRGRRPRDARGTDHLGDAEREPGRLHVAGTLRPCHRASASRSWPAS